MLAHRAKRPVHQHWYFNMNKWIDLNDLPYRRATDSERIELINLTILAKEVVKMEKECEGNTFTLKESVLQIYKEDSGASVFKTPKEWINEGARISCSARPYWIWEKEPNFDNYNAKDLGKYRELVSGNEMICLFSNLQVME